MSKFSTIFEEYRRRDMRAFLRLLLFKEYQYRDTVLSGIKRWYEKQLILEQVSRTGKNLDIVIGPKKSYIFRAGNAKINIGDDVKIYSPIEITASTHIFPDCVVEIGDRTHIGPYSAIRAAKGVTIGRDCLLASYVKLFDYNGHPIRPGSYDNMETLRNRSRTPPEEVAEIRVGDNVWIGENSIIQRGVTIGQGSVVSANSVVIKDVPENTVVFGSPARAILWLDKNGRAEK